MLKKFFVIIGGEMVRKKTKNLLPGNVKILEEFFILFERNKVHTSGFMSHKWFN